MRQVVGNGAKGNLAAVCRLAEIGFVSLHLNQKNAELDATTMNQIYISSENSESWKQFLASPERQWKDGFSAKQTAESWETACGFPHAIASLFDRSEEPSLKSLELLVGLPEYKVSLPGGSTASQTDLMAFASNQNGLIVCGVEGKAKETFGEKISAWSKNASEGKNERLAFLLETLGLEAASDINEQRYQFFHRTASVILTAEKYHARTAVMLVQSFSPKQAGFDDYSAFLQLFGLEAKIGEISKAVSVKGRDLYFGWVSDC